MKNIAFLLCISLFVFSCQNEDAEKLSKELNTLREENIDLKRQTEEIEEKDSLINAYAQFILDIQDNLNQINQKENALLDKAKNPELKVSNESILADLKSIGTLLAENEAKVKDMRTRLNSRTIEIKELEAVILKLSTEVEEKDVRIRGLKAELSDLGVAFDELLSAYEENIVLLANKNQTINQQEAELNTAYYAVGTSKELKTNGVVSKEGSFIGLGGTEKLKENFNKDYFVKVNIQNTTELMVNAKKVTFITTHPETSYKLVGTNPIEKIKITNPKEFWSVSKYLVVETK